MKCEQLREDAAPRSFRSGAANERGEDEAVKVLRLITLAAMVAAIEESLSLPPDK